jgi:hypothetical protein
MADFDLRRYLDCFPEVCRKKFGRTWSWRSLERDFEQLRTGKRWLVARDVQKIFDPGRTPFGRYWPAPNQRELDAALSQQHLVLAPVPADGREVVEQLLAVFHNIGIVSLVLRFVHPKRFGIFSTPVVNLLQIHRPTTVELYLAFCEELRHWQEHFRMASVAETEMALWAFHELVKGLAPPAEIDQARAEFDADIWIQRRRIAQVLRPFLERYGALELARILVEEHPKLAAKVAGEEYERLLRRAARRHGLKLGVRGAVGILFDRMEQHNEISLEEKTLLRRTWDTRCAAVHPERAPAAEEVENMIDTIERICLLWESRS